MDWLSTGCAHFCDWGGNGVVFLCDCGRVWVTIRRCWQGLIFDPFEPLIGGQGVSGRRSCLHCVDDRDPG